MRRLTTLILFVTISIAVSAQEKLPAFSAVNKGNDRIVISWTNPYLDTIRQLSVQRSFDSLKSFKTILTLPDPTVPQNGYMDAMAPNPRMFYRLYILLDNGRYVFSDSKRAVIDTTPVITTTKDIVPPGPVTPIQVKPLPNNATTPPVVEVFKPSRYVFTDKYGNVRLSLPVIPNEIYTIRFQEEDGRPLFEVKEIKDSVLTIDKTNFIHSGWFRFELYAENKLIESYKFFIPKDF